MKKNGIKFGWACIACITILLCEPLSVGSFLWAKGLDFTVTRLGSQEGAEPVPHILIVGGIQGDEPGGFSAAALLTTHYTFSNGFVTVVPNLNFPSIIQQARGTHGDMNRKFSVLSKSDPEYNTVRRIQELIASPQVDLILNLHDGSGFYNPRYLSKIRNPYKWGNCVIVDQATFDAPKYGDLANMGKHVADNVNKNLLNLSHAFFVKNTRTGAGNQEMAKTLTWYAIGQGKPAFGIEASKNLSLPERVYYHLHTLEAFFRYAGITYSRRFELNPASIKTALSTEIYIGFAENRVVLPLSNVRRGQLGSFPLPRNGDILANSPILAAVQSNHRVQVHYGNNRVTSFRPDWHEMDTALQNMTVLVDGTRQTVGFGDMVYAKNSFQVLPMKGYRVNAIGAVMTSTGRGDESGYTITRKNFQTRYSVDNKGSIYRVEVYKAKKYVGTFMVAYQMPSNSIVATPLPAVKGKESNLGR